MLLIGCTVSILLKGIPWSFNLSQYRNTFVNGCERRSKFIMNGSSPSQLILWFGIRIMSVAKILRVCLNVQRIIKSWKYWVTSKKSYSYITWSQKFCLLEERGQPSHRRLSCHQNCSKTNVFSLARNILYIFCLNDYRKNQGCRLTCWQ